MRQDTALCWFRRDLRLDDHAALFHAARAHARVACVFIFDRQILELLPRADRRVEFIWHALAGLKQQLQQHGSDLVVTFGSAEQEIVALAQRFAASAVYAAEDYEPGARQRDQRVAQQLEALGSRLQLVKDQVIFARDEVLAKNRTPYTVFTPYKKSWLSALTVDDWLPYDSQHALSCLTPLPATPLPTLQHIGFAPTDLAQLGVALGESGARQLLQDFSRQIDHYHERRDYPALEASSHLSPHLRFGTISIRRLVAQAVQQRSAGADSWLSELIWREFYQQLLWHFPRIADESFKLQYRALAFDNNPAWFAAWQAGQTGFPLVDAAMRQLQQTGWMHNRLRMVCASFLVKDLLIDWRWGEQHFAQWLLDFDLAANNGGWQWAASTGCDAQPYFRIFNPVTQSQRFDPDGAFIRRFVPELASLPDRDIHAPWLARQLPPDLVLGRDYPLPLVDHALQRERALTLFSRQ